MINFACHNVESLMIRNPTESHSWRAQLWFTYFWGNHYCVHQKQNLFQRRLFWIQARCPFKGKLLDRFLLKIDLYSCLHKFYVYIYRFESQYVWLVHQKVVIFYVNVDLVWNQSHTNTVPITWILNDKLHLREVAGFNCGLLSRHLNQSW